MNLPTKRVRGEVSPSDDTSIPLLTERLGLPGLDFDTKLPVVHGLEQTLGVQVRAGSNRPTATPEPQRPGVVPRVATTALPELPPLPGLTGTESSIGNTGATVAGATVAPPPRATDGQHWGRIETELRASVLRQVAELLPREIDSIVCERMHYALTRLLAGLAEETERAMAGALEDIVTQAVKAELERLRTSKPGAA